MRMTMLISTNYTQDTDSLPEQVMHWSRRGIKGMQRGTVVHRALQLYRKRFLQSKGESIRSLLFFAPGCPDNEAKMPELLLHRLVANSIYYSYRCISKDNDAFRPLGKLVQGLHGRPH